MIKKDQNFSQCFGHFKKRKSWIRAKFFGQSKSWPIGDGSTSSASVGHKSHQVRDKKQILIFFLVSGFLLLWVRTNATDDNDDDDGNNDDDVDDDVDDNGYNDDDNDGGDVVDEIKLGQKKLRRRLRWKLIGQDWLIGGNLLEDDALGLTLTPGELGDNNSDDDEDGKWRKWRVTQKSASELQTREIETFLKQPKLLEVTGMGLGGEHMLMTSQRRKPDATDFRKR